MAHRKWLRAWLLRALVLGILFSLSDMYKWVLRGHPLSASNLLGNLLMALILSWLVVLSNQAWLVWFLSWTPSAFLGIVIYAKAEKSGPLPPTTDAVLDYATRILPLLIGTGAVALWLRAKRNPKPSD